VLHYSLRYYVDKLIMIYFYYFPYFNLFEGHSCQISFSTYNVALHFLLHAVFSWCCFISGKVI